MSTQFNCQKHFYFKLFSLFKQLYVTIQSSVSTVSMSKITAQFQTFLAIKLNFKLFLAIKFSQAVLIQLFQFSISTNFVYT